MLGGGHSRACEWISSGHVIVVRAAREGRVHREIDERDFDLLEAAGAPRAGPARAPRRAAGAAVAADEVDRAASLAGHSAELVTPRPGAQQVLRGLPEEPFMQVGLSFFPWGSCCSPAALVLSGAGWLTLKQPVLG